MILIIIFTTKPTNVLIKLEMVGDLWELIEHVLGVDWNAKKASSFYNNWDIKLNIGNSISHFATLNTPLPGQALYGPNMEQHLQTEMNLILYLTLSLFLSRYTYIICIYIYL